MPIREGEKVSDEHLSIHDDLRKSPQKYDFCDELTDVFHRTTVGAYRIRPDVSENEMIAANKPPTRYWSNKCRGVSHTPSNERKWNDSCEHVSPVEHPFSPPWRAYAIRPYGFTINRIDLTNCMDAREYALHGGENENNSNALVLTALLSVSSL